MRTKTDELEDRVEAKRHELQARLAELKADTRSEAAEMRASIRKRLDEVAPRSHYFQATLPAQFDEYIWFDETDAIEPLGGAVPPGHPFALGEARTR